LSIARLIAWRYLRRPTDRLVSAVGIASLAGLIIGVMALVISMALMTGYRRDLERKLLGGNAELFVYSVQGGIGDAAALLETIRAVPGVAEASPVLFQSALVSSETHATGEQVMLKGVERGRDLSSPFFARVVGARPASVHRKASREWPSASTSRRS
jgi:lipoprotein-releasing system permease protein